MYGDFFDAPRTIQKPAPGTKRSKAKVNDKVKGKGKGKGRRARFEAEEEEDEEEEDGDEAREVMGRFKEDLFADDDEVEEEPERGKSQSDSLLQSRTYILDMFSIVCMRC